VAEAAGSVEMEETPDAASPVATASRVRSAPGRPAVVDRAGQLGGRLPRAAAMMPASRSGAAHRPLIQVTVGRRGIRVQGTTDGSVSLQALHDQVCRRLRELAPYPIGPIHIGALGFLTVSVDARRQQHPFQT
jgi:hypothetical protein